VGTTVCVNGVITCQGSTGGGPEQCNNFDDDCDGIVDEDVPDGGTCDAGGTLCNGVLKCIGGNPNVCVGDTVHPETCNCDDDDCDGKTDEQPPALCPGGATCTSCQCAFQCSIGEFPCPVGKLCNADKFCVNDPCFNVTCDPDTQGNKTECKEGACVVSCSLVSCPSGTVCVGSTGQCAPDDCRTFPERCQADQLCVAGVCESNPCAGVTCDSNKYCQAGVCVGSCADVDCPAGQTCALGACVANPCSPTCFPGQVCQASSGACVADPCIGRNCPQGQACDSQTGQCGADPCLGVTCPGAGQICKGGSCYDPGQFQPDAGSSTPEYVTAAGGGCATENGGGGAAIVLVGLFLALRPRRKAGGRS
jgi:Notch 1